MTFPATAPGSRIPFFVLAAILAPISLPNAQTASQGKTLTTLAGIREAWVEDLHDKKLEPILKFYAPDAAFLQPSASESGVPQRSAISSRI
jgi:hypothetical protein